MLRIMAIILFALNIIVLIVSLPSLRAEFYKLSDTAEKVGFIFGVFLLSYIAIVLLLVARRVSKKIKQKAAQAELADFLS